MLLRATYQNYRCLRDATISFAPLTILVGPNASGKSSVLHSLQLLSLSHGFHQTDFWQNESGSKVEIRFTATQPPGGDVEHVFWMSGGPHTRHRVPSRLAVQLLSLDLQQLRRSNMLESGTQIDSVGGNLANVFATLDRATQQAAVQAFCRLVPVFSDIHAAPLSQGEHQLRFRDAFRKDVWFTPSQVSDGTMLVLAYLLTQYQTPQVDLLAIEEPERGLHPYLIGSLVKFLRGMAHGEVGGKPVQIVLATHSASLLDHADPKEVRFFQRAADGSVTIESAPTGDATWSEYYSNYQESLGQAWLSGGLGGVPGG